jgi:LexA-binding, inner membrane-associated putative hydrolase
MPSPIGHMLAGAAVAWTADLVPGDRAWRTAPAAASWYRRAGDGLTLACGVLGALADLDLVVPRTHRMFTHSIGAVGVVLLAAAVLSVAAHRPVARVAAMCATAYGSHLLLDWLAVDNFPPRGIQLWWPMTDTWYISDLDLFWQTARNNLFASESLRLNAIAIAGELASLVPILAGLWLVRVKALAGFASEVPSGDHAT